MNIFLCKVMNKMCGRLNVSDDPFLVALLKNIGIESPREKLTFGRFKRATDSISIVREINGVRQIDNAVWWLLLDKTEHDFKPSKYTSFNTRSDKLNIRNSAGYIPFRQSRCIIPAKGFGETEFKNKKPIHYYDMEDIDGEASHDYSGGDVSLSADGNVVAIGASGNDGNGLDSGHVRLYEWSGSAWNQLGNDIDGEMPGDQSQIVSLSADGSTVAIGALFNDGNGYSSGHVRVFTIE